MKRSYQLVPAAGASQFALTKAAASTTTSEGLLERAARLSQVTYEALLRDRLAYGTPDVVAERLGFVREPQGLFRSSSSRPWVGIDHECVYRSLWLFVDEVVPKRR